MNQDSITEIQEALRLLSGADPRLIPVAVDGIYGHQTEEAVRIFQTLNGLEPTGDVDAATWEELRDSVRDAQGVHPISINAFPHPAFLLRPGESNELAGIVQYMINSIASVYDNVQPVTVSNTYTLSTVEEISRLQAAHRMEPTGVLDAETWNILVTLYNNRMDTVKR